MTFRFSDVKPTVWLLEGIVTHKGNEHAFWYEYDERDGDENYEFTDDMPSDSFDLEQFAKDCWPRSSANGIPRKG